MISKVLVLVMLFGSSFSSDAKSERKVIFVGHEMEPFFFKAGSDGLQGAIYEISQEICRLQKDHCLFKIASFRTNLEMVAEGRADMGGPLGYTEPRNQVYHFSHPVFSTRYCFYTSPKNFKPQFTLEDLKGRTVGVVGPSATQLSLEKIREALHNGLHIKIENSNHSALRKAQNQSNDFGYVNCDNGRTWLQHTRSDLREIPHLGEPTHYHFYFSRKTFTPEDVKRVNASLDQLRKSGFLREVADKYKLTLAEDNKMN